MRAPLCAGQGRSPGAPRAGQAVCRAPPLCAAQGVIRASRSPADAAGEIDVMCPPRPGQQLSDFHTAGQVRGAWKQMRSPGEPFTMENETSKETILGTDTKAVPAPFLPFLSKPPGMWKASPPPTTPPEASRRGLQMLAILCK